MRRLATLQRPVPPIAVAVLASAWMALPGNAALWRELQALGLLARPGGWALAAALATLVAATLVMLIALASWRRSFKPVVCALLLASALGSHFMLAYHVVIDAGMLENVLQTDRAESAALVGAGLLASLAWGALLPAWAIARVPVQHRPWRAQAGRNLAAVLASAGVLVLAAAAAFQPLASAMRNHKQLRYLMNPLNALYAAGQLAARPLRHPPGAVQPLGLDAQFVPSGQRPPLLVLVIGETARSGNFGINGYARATTPRLEREHVASFTNAWSCGTSTAASLPCMFSHLGRDGFGRRTSDQENLLDVLQHAGLAVLWIDNQSGCKGVCDRVPQATTAHLGDPRHCRDGECLDGVMLEGLDERLAALPPQRVGQGVVVVLHQMGAHGPAYSRRSPRDAKRFLPECTSIELQDCDREGLVNAYDNAIAYTDQVLADTIAWLRGRQQRFDTAMLYVADHGESLGENNLYLHGMPWSLAPDVQKRVPWVTWLSPGFERRSGVTTECLQRQRTRELSHDHLFHSVLGLLHVQTSAYAGRLDAFASCAAH